MRPKARRPRFDSGSKILNFDQIVSFTVAANKPSWSVMERIGMTRDPGEDFDHPRLPAGIRFDARSVSPDARALARRLAEFFA